MSEPLMMSKKERERLSIIKRVASEEMTVTAAATAMTLSERQVWRILKRFRARSDAGLVHMLRGRASNRGHSDAAREQIVTLYRQRYADYGPTLFCEQLEEHHGIVLGVESARRLLKQAGLWAANTRKHPHRKKRPRRTAHGELVQFDGSRHKWFEDRGPECTLLHAIDDATNHTMLRLVSSENTADCLRFMREYFQQYGIPHALYVDFGSVYKDGEQRTQFERAMDDCGVKIIHAHSPEAKGRVERGNRTHQDRLVKELRQAGITNMADANAYLERTYLDKHNARFATTEGIPDVHRQIDGLDLDRIMCFHYPRVVARDYTIQFEARYIQLLPSAAPLPTPAQRVTLCIYLDTTMHIFFNDQELAFIALDARPRRPRRDGAPLPQTHQWRRQNRRLKVHRERPSRTRIMTPP